VVYASLNTTSDQAQGCALPAAGTPEGRQLDQVRQSAPFAVLYPCSLPAGEKMVSAAGTGEVGRRSVTMVFEGPFEISLKQSQAPPAVSPDPSGSTRVEITLMPGVRATLIERNDGTRRSFYHLLWEKDRLYYEVIATGPPQSRRLVLELAKSLQ
jgi:hypothetical protein